MNSGGWFPLVLVDLQCFGSWVWSCLRASFLTWLLVGLGAPPLTVPRMAWVFSQLGIVLPPMTSCSFERGQLPLGFPCCHVNMHSLFIFWFSKRGWKFKFLSEIWWFWNIGFWNIGQWLTFYFIFLTFKKLHCAGQKALSCVFPSMGNRSQAL